MNNIIYDNKIITPEDHKWNYYNNFLKKLDKKNCVKFSLFCAKIVNPNTKESNHCIGLVEKWLVDENSVVLQELWDAAEATPVATATTNASAAAASAAYAAAAYSAAYYAADAVVYAVIFDAVNINIINKYLQVLLRKTKQFQNNKILEQISKTDVDKLELVDWNMITDIMQEEYNIVHEFEYKDIFSRRCLIELLRKEYIWII